MEKPTATTEVAGLTGLASQLRNIRFEDEDCILEEAALTRRLYNCQKFPGNNTWGVRFSFRGAWRIVGIVNNAGTAARFADMCRARFHQFKGEAHGPVESLQFNFNWDQVQADMGNRDAVDLIEKIEHLLLDQWFIDRPGEAVPWQRATRETKGSAILDKLTAIELRLATIESILAGTGRPND